MNLPHKNETSPDSADISSERAGGFLHWLKRLVPDKPRNDDTLREAIEDLMNEEEGPQSAVARHERYLISNILNLRDLPVSDIMVPRADIVAVEESASTEELLAIVAEKPHSRIPVYKGDLDNITGVVHIKDMVTALAAGRGIAISDILREPLVVSPAMRVMDLLLHMRQSKMHIAFVVDEFGGIDGLITINDAIEVIVGKIGDEYDLEIEPRLIERPDGTLIADARYPITEFESIYGNIFREDEENEDVDTLGGLVTALSGRVPARGEVVRHGSGVTFEVLEADPRRVMRLRLRNLPKPQARATEDNRA